MALSTCWSMTLNNPTEEMMVLVRNPNQDYIRQLIWTAEEESTPHIQAYVKLIKQQRMSFIKKLYPGGHFQPISSAEYLRNAVDYAQKEDDTTRGAHVNTLADTIADPVYLLNRLVRTIIDRELAEWVDQQHDAEQLFSLLNQRTPGDMVSVKFQDRFRLRIQDEELLLVRERPSICKLLVSAQYHKIKMDYLLPIVKYNIDKYIQTRDADDNEGEGSGESELYESESISSASEEDDSEEAFDEDCAIESIDGSSQSDCEEERGDEVCD